MGVNFLITWAIIDPVMRAVITETRVSSLASSYCNNAETRVSTLASWSLQCCWDASFNPRVLVLAVLQRREFQPSRLGGDDQPCVWSSDSAFW